MILNLLAKPWPDSDFDALLEAFSSGKNVTVSGLKGSAKALYLTLLQRPLNMPVVLFAASTKQAEEYHHDLLFLADYFGIDRSSIVYFPASDTEPYQGVSPHPQVSVLRMQALWRLAHGRASTIIVPIQAAARMLPPRENFERSFAKIGLGDRTGPQQLIEMLLRFGYKEKDLVTSRGEFSARGGILDLYSPAEDLPVRLEFYGDTVESMREFESNTQRSVREVDQALVLGLREIQVSEKEVTAWGEAVQKRWTSDFFHEELTDKTEELLETGHFENYEEFISSFFEKTSGILDFVPGEFCLLLDDPQEIGRAYGDLRDQYEKRYQQIHELARLALPPEEILIGWENMFAGSGKRYLLTYEQLAPEPSPDTRSFDYSFQSARQYHGQVQEIVNDLLRQKEAGFTSVVIMPTAGKAERLAEILNEYESPALYFRNPSDDSDLTLEQMEGRIVICLGNLTHGFKNHDCNVSLLTEDDLFGETRPVVQAPSRKPAGTFLSDLRDLKLHDYVVHIDHGIGQFMGLSTMPIDSEDREFLLLRFADDDKLYVPVERLDLVQKYMGASDVTPRLDRLGTNVWQKTKSRAKASMKEMAEKLLQLYAYRKTVKGYAYAPDDSQQHEFEDAFEFQETPHQISAIEDVKADMESDKPMDRLICGDVGYGKTEVAMRAAFKVVNNGKQVAVLAPTTILAFQHFHTFGKRFEMFPIRTEMVSRFRSRQEIRKTLEDLREGKVDIIIGTHRLLSKDVQFQDLGLLIVDEEQRFGVAHKERLKEMKKEVDAMTLTATPIPRTLQMALMGFRPMSVIETPPKDRLAIQTNIVKYNEDTISAAIRAELKRGGQVYFVHNRVETIHSIASMVQRLVPEGRIGVAHGQMEERELEKVMMRFIDHEFDVLISTTIIENGIDIPLVNTLIVNRADKFGLSQLYQLRGRVGRSHRRAYAYFLIPSEKELTPIARKRLAALREFTELGSGFRLAALDLEIRGAGNLLGGEQHGHIAALGFELYCRMLEQTVKELQGQEAQLEFSTNLNLNIDIRIPEDYIPNMNQRLNLYKRIATAQSEETFQHLRDEMTDRFGTRPESVENLLEYGGIKMLAERLRIRSIDRSEGSLYFQLSEDGRVDPQIIVQFIRRHKGAALSPSGILSLPAEKLHIPKQLFATLQLLLAELSGKVPETARRV